MGLVAIIIFGIWDFGLNDMVLFAFCLVKADQYLIYRIRLTHISAVAGLKSGQSNQKRIRNRSLSYVRENPQLTGPGHYHETNTNRK